MSTMDEKFFFLHKKLDAMQDCLDLIKANVICEDVPVCSFRVFYGDSENGQAFFDDDYIHNATVNGTAIPALPYTNATDKSGVYQNVMDAVNALPDHSMAVDTDVVIGGAGEKVSFLVDVPDGETLTIVNTHNGDVLELVAGEGGECSGTFKDSNGDDIGSWAPVVL